MHDFRLPGGGRDGREFAGQSPARGFAAGEAQGVAEGGDLAGFQVDRALCEPADGLAERLLAKLDATGGVGGLDQDEQEAFGFAGGREGGEDRFHGASSP